MSAHDKRLSLDVDVSNMSAEEVLQFESVLNRNDAVNMMELNRIRRLKSSVDGRKDGASTPTTQTQNRFQKLVCQKCGSLCPSPSVTITDDDEPSNISVMLVCRVCRSVLCRTCWGASTQGNRLRICVSCYQRIVLDAKTGHWFHQQIKSRLPSLAGDQTDPAVPEYQRESTIYNRQSPKKNLLRRLRSYSSMHEQLDDDDDGFDAPVRGDRVSDSTEEEPATMTASFYINSESADEDGDQGRPDAWSIGSQRNYYRPLSYIATNPIKSSCNGSPISVDESSSIDRWKNLVTDEEAKTTLIVAAVPEPGEVLIELDFNFRMSQFIVVLRQCRNLPVADQTNKLICPYLFLLLLPDRSKKSRRTTSVKKNTFCPSYDQIFKYSINFTELESRSLLVMLCHKDDHSTRDLALGQVIISLSFLEFSKPIIRWYPFQLLGSIGASMPYERSPSVTQRKKSNIPPYLGEISLAIKYVSHQLLGNSTNNHSRPESPGELHVWIKSMRNIAIHQWTTSPSVPSNRRYSSVEDNYNDDTQVSNGLNFGGNRLLEAVKQLGLTPPVARVCLLPYRTNTQTTHAARTVQADNGAQFTWSTILKFSNIDLEELRTRSMEVTVWVNSRHGWLTKIIQSKCMGGVRLSRGGQQSVPESCNGNGRGVSTGVVEEKMWNAMLERQNTWVDGTVKLRMESSFLIQAAMQ